MWNLWTPAGFIWPETEKLEVPTLQKDQKAYVRAIDWRMYLQNMALCTFKIFKVQAIMNLLWWVYTNNSW